MAVPDPAKPAPVLPEEVPGLGTGAPLAGADFLDPLFGTGGGAGGREGEHGRDVALLEPAADADGEADAGGEANAAAAFDGPGFEPGGPGFTILEEPTGDPGFPSTFETPPEAEFFAEQVLSGEPGPFTPIEFFFTPFVASAAAPVPLGETLFGGAGADTLTGGPNADSLFGFGGGNDFLDGGAGTDKLTGGAGDDVFRLNDPNDTVIELPSGDGGGFDTIEAGDPLIAAIGAGTAPASFAFSGAAIDARMAVDADHLFFLGDFVETLHLLEAVAANAVGNVDANTITGNAGANAFWGGAGDDFLSGMGGGDSLAGGEGDDFLAGGGGDDVYLFYGDETGFDVIQDGQGVNSATLEDFSPTTEATAGLDANGDLVVFTQDPAAPFVLFQPLFRVDGYSADPGSFSGIELGGLFVTVDDLLV